MRLPPWLWRVCRSKWTKRFLIASPFLLMIAVAAFYGVANWYGTWALEREVRVMKEEGWPVTLKEALGPPPVADQDVFRHPAVVAELALPREARVGEWTFDAPGCMSLRSLLPLVLHDPAKARNALASAAAADATFESIRHALQRPSLGWAEASIHEVMNRQALLFGWSRFACDRACFRLAAGESQLAFEDVIMALELGERLGKTPFLEALKLSGDADFSAMEAIQLGLRLRSWTEPQLSLLQAKLLKIDWHARMQSGARTEWAYQIELARSGDVSASSKPELSQVFYEFRQKVLADPFNAAKRATKEVWLNVRPEGFSQSQAMRELRKRRAYPAYSDSEQTSVNVKRVVLVAEVALERYRLKHGAVPEKLGSLVPEFLPEVPKDPYDGQPLRYQVLADGSPHVWSIGPSGRDEGGIPNRYGKMNTAWSTGQIPGLTEAVYNAR